MSIFDIHFPRKKKKQINRPPVDIYIYTYVYIPGHSLLAILCELGIGNQHTYSVPHEGMCAVPYVDAVPDIPDVYNILINVGHRVGHQSGLGQLRANISLHFESIRVSYRLDVKESEIFMRVFR